MRSPQTQAAAFSTQSYQICRFHEANRKVRDMRHWRTSLTFYDLQGDPARLSVLEISQGERAQNNRGRPGHPPTTRHSAARQALALPARVTSCPPESARDVERSSNHSICGIHDPSGIPASATNPKRARPQSLLLIVAAWQVQRSVRPTMRALRSRQWYRPTVPPARTGGLLRRTGSGQ
jgi:hypothetical protein